MNIQEIIKIRSIKLFSAKVQDMLDEEKTERHVLFAKDSYDWVIDSKKLLITFVREIESEKASSFCIKVEMKAVFDILNDNEENVKEIMEEGNGINQMLYKVASEASLIIAQITKSMGIGPLISSPMYQRKDN